jgi:hypothetical protein
MPTINDFWSWFVANEDTYYGFHRMDLEDKNYHLERLLEQLQAFDPCIGVVLVGPKHLTKATLTITADGNPNGFLYIQNLVEKAPTLPRWEFVAFIQPSVDIGACMDGTDPPYEFYRMPVKISELYWLPLEPEEGDTSGKMNINLYFKGFDESVKGLGFEQVRANISHILQDLLGELDLERHIGSIHLQDTDPTESPLGLYDLPAYIYTDEFFNSD